MGYRNSYRHSARGRKGRARHQAGQPNLTPPDQTSGRNQPGQPIGLRVPPGLPVPAIKPKPLARRPEDQVRVEVRKPSWLANGGWYPLVTLPTLGFASWIPFTHAGSRLKSTGTQLAGFGYSFVSIISFGLMGEATTTATGVVGLVLLLAGLVAGTSHLVVLSRRIGVRNGRPVKVIEAPRRHKPQPDQKETPKPQVDPALAKALAARDKRRQARALAATDPVLADELHIGRPDLGRTYDDGGLVDVNNAPAATISSVCRIKLADAKAIVELREERGGFANVDEMLVLVDLPVSAWDRVRERAITPSV
jgi:hypothetical protein